MSFYTIPKELHYIIFSYSNLDTLGKCLTLNKDINKLITENKLLYRLPYSFEICCETAKYYISLNTDCYVKHKRHDNSFSRTKQIHYYARDTSFNYFHYYAINIFVDYDELILVKYKSSCICKTIDFIIDKNRRLKVGKYLTDNNFVVNQNDNWKIFIDSKFTSNVFKDSFQIKFELNDCVNKICTNNSKCDAQVKYLIYFFDFIEKLVNLNKINNTDFLNNFSYNDSIMEFSSIVDL